MFLITSNFAISSFRYIFKVKVVVLNMCGFFLVLLNDVIVFTLTCSINVNAHVFLDTTGV